MADTGRVSRPTSLRSRHEPETARDLSRARTRLRNDIYAARRRSGNPDTAGEHDDLAQVAHDLWHGWTPVDLGLDPRIGVGGDGAMLWTYHRPDRGWALMFLPEAHTRWAANPGEAIRFATDYSASGSTLTTVCTRLLSMGDAIPDWSTQAVALLLTRPALQHDLAAQRVEFFLALRGLTANLAAAAKGHGYGIPFAAP